METDATLDLVLPYFLFPGLYLYTAKGAEDRVKNVCFARNLQQ